MGQSGKEAAGNRERLTGGGSGATGGRGELPKGGSGATGAQGNSDHDRLGSGSGQDEAETGRWGSTRGNSVLYAPKHVMALSSRHEDYPAFNIAMKLPHSGRNETVSSG